MGDIYNQELKAGFREQLFNAVSRLSRSTVDREIFVVINFRQYCITLKIKTINYMNEFSFEC